MSPEGDWEGGRGSSTGHPPQFFIERVQSSALGSIKDEESACYSVKSSARPQRQTREKKIEIVCTRVWAQLLVPPNDSPAVSAEQGNNE